MISREKILKPQAGNLRLRGLDGEEEKPLLRYIHVFSRSSLPGLWLRPPLARPNAGISGSGASTGVKRNGGFGFCYCDDKHLQIGVYLEEGRRRRITGRPTETMAF